MYHALSKRDISNHPYASHTHIALVSNGIVAACILWVDMRTDSVRVRIDVCEKKLSCMCTCSELRLCNATCSDQCKATCSDLRLCKAKQHVATFAYAKPHVANSASTKMISETASRPLSDYRYMLHFPFSGYMLHVSECRYMLCCTYNFGSNHSFF